MSQGNVPVKPITLRIRTAMLQRFFAMVLMVCSSYRNELLKSTQTNHTHISHAPPSKKKRSGQSSTSFASERRCSVQG
jgi:hypothetical protein